MRSRCALLRSFDHIAAEMRSFSVEIVTAGGTEVIDMVADDVETAADWVIGLQELLAHTEGNEQGSRR